MDTLKIVVAHNRYQQRGGEDVVLEMESKLLQECGVDLDLLLEDNDGISTSFSKLKAACGATFSVPQYFKYKKYFNHLAPDVLHVHNFFPRISPAIFYASKACGVPSVMTLHNFRTICPTTTLLHHDAVTERSITDGPFWAVKEKVYRGSALGTFALASMISVNKFFGTWRNCIDGYIALTEFSRQKFIQAGFPADKIHVKPNFIFDPGYDHASRAWETREFALFVGRLAPEKGVSVMLEAWKRLGIPLVVVGGGPLEAQLKAVDNPAITFLGTQSPASVQQLMRRARFLVMPSVWYEGFPMTLLEAFAVGLPVVASDIGSLAELVQDGVTGKLARAGDAEHLAATCETLYDSKGLLEEMSVNARAAYAGNYTPEINVEQLLRIYDLIRRKK